jgi:prevent-host-death family protein
MKQVNMLEAKTNLSKLVQAVENGTEREIVLARHGKPVARIVPIAAKPKNRRLGIADGQFGTLDEAWFRDFQALDGEIEKAMAERWERFEQHTLELEREQAGRGKKTRL